MEVRREKSRNVLITKRLPLVNKQEEVLTAAGSGFCHSAGLMDQMSAGRRVQKENRM